MKEQENQVLPGKLCFIGKNFYETRSVLPKELILRIEMDIEALEEKHCEFGIAFYVSCDSSKYSKDGEIVVKAICDDENVLEAIREDIEAILSSYNKQTFIKVNGHFKSYYLRFSYRIEFCRKDLLVIKGGQDSFD